MVEQIELQAKLLNYFLGSNKSNINPLRSCRKIGGKAAVQQSCSKRTRRNPSPKMIKVTVHEETRGQWKKRPNPATAHTQSQHRGEQTTSRSSALVRGQSTQFIANPCRWPQRPSPKRGYISAIFPPFSVCNKFSFLRRTFCVRVKKFVANSKSGI
jgi:hypothetical protein